MILVVGSTGLVGGEIAHRLCARGHTVRALVRDGSDPVIVAHHRQVGIDTVTGDLKEPPSIAAACRGVHTVISTASATRTRQEGDTVESVDGQGQLDLIEAARAAGVEHFILVSVAGIYGAADPVTAAKRAAEERLRESGMRYTILRPAAFMEVWLSPALGFDYPNARATIYGTGEQRISFVSLMDVAEYAVLSVNRPAVRDLAIEIGGPAAVSPNEVVRIFEQATGRPFQVQYVPEEALAAQAAAATDSLARAFAAFMLSYARGAVVEVEPAQSLYGLQRRTVQDYAESLAEAMRAPADRD